LTVSNPKHSRYGQVNSPLLPNSLAIFILTSAQHLTYEEVNDLIKPTDNTLDLVHEWLEANGIIYVTYSPTIDWINIDVNIQTTKRLLDAEYYTFQHEDGTKVVRAPEWSLPKHLHKHVNTIQPTTSFMRPVKRADIAATPIP